MAGEFSHLHHGRVLPQAQLVLAEPVGAQDLLLVLAPLEGTHLGLGVDAVHTGTGVGVPELDAPVRGTAASGEQVALEGAPRKGLHGGLVLVQAVKRSRRGGRRRGSVPDVQQVVVASARQLLARGRPLQPAHLLLMGCQEPFT